MNTFLSTRLSGRSYRRPSKFAPSAKPRSTRGTSLRSLCPETKQIKKRTTPINTAPGARAQHSRPRPDECGRDKNGNLFLDPRSHYNEKSGLTTLFGKDKTALRREVYTRARGMCEAKVHTIAFGEGRMVNERCYADAPWSGPLTVRGHLAHKTHGRGKRDDTKQGCLWKCADHHLREHGLKSAKRSEAA